ISLLQGRFISLYFTYQNGSVPVKLCDYPHIENGRLTGYYKNHREKDFPVRLGVTIFYRCLDGYVSKSESTWNLIRCTADGWDPMPKCLSKTEVPHGYFYETKNRFGLNEKATYRCQIDYMTPEGNETGEIQCLEEGWSPFPECIKTCRMPAFEHIRFYTSKMVFLPEDILEYECADGYQTVNKISRGHTICSINGWTPEPQCFVEIKACGPPPSITNGNIISELHEKYQHGDSVEYDCNLRFKMIGSKSIECVDGEWSSSPFCIGACKKQLKGKGMWKRTFVQISKGMFPGEVCCKEQFNRGRGGWIVHNKR
uniref:Sushi domain-containing protein n=1 Tax=Terrapene triunguis TaxID=2587831 RepID=A0A674JQ26_9SAUR